MASNSNLLLQSSITEGNQKIQALITQYKTRIQEQGLGSEIYKWKLLDRYINKPDPNAYNFTEDLNAIDYKNLIYHGAKQVIKHLTKERAYDYKQQFQFLFDESYPLSERIKTFDQETLKIYRELEPDKKLSHHHDERTIATFLTFFNPEKYTFYKSTLYSKLCKLANIATKSKGEKYVHYLELIDQLIHFYINKDSELLDIVTSLLPEDAYSDVHHNILAQDILFITLEKQEDSSRPYDSSHENSIVNEDDQTLYKTSHSLNQILYGPPGTGKTYHTINKALSIIENIDEHTLSLQSRKELKKRFDSYIQEGQISFSTFHQSMSYEDFIEGIKPEVNDTGEVIYQIKKGIFKSICERAESKESNSIDKTLEVFIKDLENNGSQELQTHTGKKFITDYNGGSTFRITPKESTANNPQYPAAIEYIKKLYLGKDTTGMYNPSYVKGILRHLINHYNLVQDNTTKDYTTAKKYVLIIDEINRGNISQIFGELITLIEHDKRAGNPEAISVTLPYSKEKFSVPKNLHIIGTMNTADRSVEALDTALRRRFSFVEMMPDIDVLQKNIENISASLFFKKEQTLVDVLTIINQRIQVLLDRDHTIGHSYFLNIHTAEELAATFTNNILPLLQEYFYNDYGKIGLILGNGFIEKKVIKTQFNFDYDGKDDFENINFQIKQLTSENIIEAINQLLP